MAGVLDSLVSESAYKKAWTLEDAIAYLQSHAGARFDPQLLALIRQPRRGRKKSTPTKGTARAPTIGAQHAVCMGQRPSQNSTRSLYKTDT